MRGFASRITEKLYHAMKNDGWSARFGEITSNKMRTTTVFIANGRRAYIVMAGFITAIHV
jgi:hypothetical protein